MLRIAVISLFVANLLLLGFQGSKPAALPETVAKRTVIEDSGIPTIHLFSEMVQDQDLMSGNRHCFSLGPFHSAEDKNRTLALLEEVSANIGERETLALVEKGYWVFMPPYESLLEANQVLLSLQALGLKDIGVIYDGEWKNAVSLGYFLRQENALKRKKDLEDRDYAPTIRVQRQAESRYWLDYEQEPGSALITLDMQNRPNDFMQRSLPCADQDPMEMTARVSETLAVEAKQPQTQLPEEEVQSPQKEIVKPKPEEISKPQAPIPEEESQSPPKEIVESKPEETSEPPTQIPEEEPQSPPEEIIESELIEISEPPPVEGDTPQQKDGDDLQSTEENDLESEEPVDVLPAIGAELETSEIPVDDTLQTQADIPEEGDGSQPVGGDGIDPEENMDNTPVDSEKEVPEPAIETEPENSVGTGPVIGFGTAPQDSDETVPDGG